MRSFYDPPPMQYNTVHSLLLKEVTATNVYGFPSYVRDLGPLVQHLARRVIWDTDRGAIVADEFIHDQSMTMCLRDSLPVDVYKLKIQYYRASPPEGNVPSSNVDGNSSDELISAESDHSIPEKRTDRRQKRRSRKARAEQRISPKEERRQKWLSAATTRSDNLPIEVRS